VKIAVFSDVHACYTRMKTVFDAIDQFGVDLSVCLGDVIGYGARPEETVQLLMEKNVTLVRGNHELAMMDPGYLRLFPHDIKQPLLDHIRTISPESRSWLERGPRSLTAHGCHFVHGTPPDKVTTYLYDVSDYYLKSVFNNSGPQLFFTGHTHIIKLVTYKGKIIYRRRIRKSRIIKVEDHVKYIVNVGSVGFSRDEFPMPKFVVYDLERREIHIQMVEM